MNERLRHCLPWYSDDTYLCGLKKNETATQKSNGEKLCQVCATIVGPESAVEEVASNAICGLERETRAKFPVRKEGTTSKFNLKEARKMIYTRLIQELQEEIERL